VFIVINNYNEDTFVEGERWWAVTSIAMTCNERYPPFDCRRN